jgi:AraC-like DNA-binding protein
MRYTEHQPSAALANHVECIWFVSDDDSSAETHSSERLLPDGCIEWIFHFGARFRQLIQGKWELQPRSFVVGGLTRFIMVQATGPVASMGIRFRPGGAYRFMPFPIDALTDQAVPTEDIWGHAGACIAEAVLGAHSAAAQRNLIELFLLSRLHLSSGRPRFEAAVSEIILTRGQTRVDQLAGRLGISSRQLEREFRARAGLSPKALARIIRFQNLLQLLGEGALRQWAMLALESGYADQPHMVREFREFSGQSPTERQAASPGDLARNFVSPQRLAALLGRE